MYFKVNCTPLLTIRYISHSMAPRIKITLTLLHSLFMFTGTDKLFLESVMARKYGKRAIRSNVDLHERMEYNEVTLHVTLSYCIMIFDLNYIYQEVEKI